MPTCRGGGVVASHGGPAEPYLARTMPQWWAGLARGRVQSQRRGRAKPLNAIGPVAMRRCNSVAIVFDFVNPVRSGRTARGYAVQILGIAAIYARLSGMRVHSSVQTTGHRRAPRATSSARL